MDVDESFEDGSDVEFSDPEPFDSESDNNDLGLSASIEIRRPPSFEAMEEAVLLNTNTQLVQEVSEILSLPKPVALILLRQYRCVLPFRGFDAIGAETAVVLHITLLFCVSDPMMRSCVPFFRLMSQLEQREGD